MAVEYATDVLALFDTRIATISSESPDGGFRKSGYRLNIDKEPDSPGDGLYFVSVLSMTPHKRVMGVENISEMTVAVDVAYFLGGGDLDGGDRQTTTRNAADDCQRLADIIEHTAYYDGSNSGVREIRYQGSSILVDQPHKQVWRSLFWVQWRSDWITA